MAYTTIKKPSDYFNTVLYTGDATSDRTITNNFATEFLWLKERNGTDNHQLWDKVRGDGKRLQSNLTNAESDTGTYIALTSNGFKVDGGTYNNSGSQYAAWQWLANGTGSSNTDGSITSTVSANTTSGFSIVSYTGTGSNATVGHGLNSVPKIVLTKNRDTADNWLMYNASTGNTKALYLNETYGTGTSSAYWNNTSPTSSVFSVGTEVPMNKSGDSIIAYCFAEVKGFSKFGSYTGNGSTDGTFCFTGFKPALIIAKETNESGDNWVMFDNKRDGFNVNNDELYPNLTNAEADGATNAYVDLLSNGFKWRSTATNKNQSGSTYIYMAFAEEPLVGDNPATAR